jgi:hypothetical protein
MITKTIEDEIRACYSGDHSQYQMAGKYKVSQPYLNMLLSGRRKFSGLTLEKIDRMFPHAVIHLHGEPPQPPPVVQTAQHARTISQSVGGDAGRLDAVRAIVACASLTDTEKIKALKPLLGME